MFGRNRAKKWAQRELARRESLRRGRGAEELATGPVPLDPPLREGSRRSGGSRSRSRPQSSLAIAASPRDDYSVAVAEQLLVAIGPSCPVAFEVVGRSGKVAMYIAAAEANGDAVAEQILAHHRRCEVTPCPDPLIDAPLRVARLFCLDEAPVFMLRNDHKTETYAALIGALASLNDGQFGMVQTVLQPAHPDWRRAILDTAIDSRDPGRSVFFDEPDLPRRARDKVSRPVYAVSLRLAGSSQAILTQLEGAFLAQFAGEQNRLLCRNEPYPLPSILARTALAPGMLLSLQELAALVHIPDPRDMPPRAMRLAQHSAPAPPSAQGNILVPLGMNRHRGRAVAVGIDTARLGRHVSIFGAIGYGKTNLLKLFIAVVDAGYGLAFLDPAGDAARDFVDLVPAHRADDVLYLDFTDRDWPPGLNVLGSDDERERENLASELVLGLSHLFPSSWGDRLEWILRQTIRALLHSGQEMTLRDITRMLCEDGFRDEILGSVEDVDLLRFWTSNFPNLAKGRALEPVLNKLSRFLDNPLVRNVVSQPNKVDFGQVLREGKVLICNLSKGELTEESSTVLGSFILSRLKIAALARARVPERDRHLYPILVDEIHNYMGGSDTHSIRTFLIEARKYRVPLVMATQYPSQLTKEVSTALFSTVDTLVCLRTGSTEAKRLAAELGDFGPDDLLNLGVGQAVVRLGRAEDTFNVDIPEVRTPAMSCRGEIIRRSQERYCRPREEVERALLRDLAPNGPDEKEESVVLEPDEAQFIDCLVRDPEQTVTEAAAAAGFGGYRASRVRRDLVDKGLAVEIKTRLGRGGTVAKFVIPTLKAYEALGRDTPPGRGGPVHRHFQRVIAELARTRGHRAMVEHHIEGGSVDVHLETPEGPVAVELSANLRTRRELGNLRKCLQAGYHQVICLLLDEQSERQMRELAKRELGEDELDRVRIGRLDRYAKFI